MGHKAKIPDTEGVGHIGWRPFLGEVADIYEIAGDKLQSRGVMFIKAHYSF